MATLTWVRPNSNRGLWSDGANWSGGVAPTANDDVVFSGIKDVEISGTANYCRNITSAGSITDWLLPSGAELQIHGSSIDMYGIYDINDNGEGLPCGTIVFHNANTSYTQPLTASQGDVNYNLRLASGAGLTINGVLIMKPNTSVDLSNGTLYYNNTISAGFIKLDGTTITRASGYTGTEMYFYATSQAPHQTDPTLPAAYIDYNSTTIDAAFTTRRIYLTPPNPGYTKVFFGDDSTNPENVVNKGIDLYVEGAASSANGRLSITGGVRNAEIKPTLSLTYELERLYGELDSGGQAYGDGTLDELGFGAQMTLCTVSGESAITKRVLNYLRIPGFTFSNTSGSPVTWTISGSANAVEGDVNFESGATNTTLVLNRDLVLQSGGFYSRSTVTRTVQTNGYSIVCYTDFDISPSTNLTFLTDPAITITTGSSGTTVIFNSGSLTNCSLTVNGFNSGGTAQLTGAVNNLTVNNLLHTITSFGTVTVYGNVSIGGTNATFNPTLSFTTGSTQTFSGNNASIGGNITVNKPGATFQLTSAFSMTSSATLTHTAGTFDFNGQTCSIGTFNSSNTNTRTVAIGDATISITGSGTAWNCGTSTNLTVTYGAAGRINMTSGLAKTFAGGGKIWPTVNQGGTGTLSVTGNNTFLNFTNTVTGCTIAFPSGTTTFTNFNVKGAFGSLVTMSSTSTLSKATGTVSVNYLNLSNSTATGGADWYAGTSSIDGGGNSGWQFIGSSSGGGFLAFF